MSGVRKITIFCIFILTLVVMSQKYFFRQSNSPRMAVATYVNINVTNYLGDDYVQNALFLLNQVKRYSKGSKVDYLLLYSGKGTPSPSPIKLPEHLLGILNNVDVIPISVPEHEGAPIWWFYKMGVKGHDGYKRTIGKIHLWTLEDYYDKILYLDSDIIFASDIVKPLFSYTEGHNFAAILDYSKNKEHISEKVPYGCKNYFNAGLFVLKPSKKVYQSMVRFFGNTSYQIENQNEWDKGWADQDFLNFYFGASWKRIPSIYNVDNIRELSLSNIKSAVVIHDKIWVPKVLNALPNRIQSEYQRGIALVKKMLDNS